MTALPTNLKVVIADDERSIADTLAAILRNNGIQSFAVYSGEEALSLSSMSPDIVITDVMMGELSGIDLAIMLRELCPGCRVLLISGASETATLLKSARQNGHKFEVLAKPFHPSMLIEWISSGAKGSTPPDVV